MDEVELVVEEVGVVLDVDEVDEVGSAIMMKSLPTELVPAVVHTSRVALAPTGLLGRPPVMPRNPPLAVDVNAVELRGVPVGSGPENTSSTPSLSPVPLGQPTPANSISVPGGPVSGWMV